MVTPPRSARGAKIIVYEYLLNCLENYAIDVTGFNATQIKRINNATADVSVFLKKKLAGNKKKSVALPTPEVVNAGT